MTHYAKAPLGELLEQADSGFACAKRNLVAIGLPHLRPFNITADGRLDLSDTYLVPFDAAPKEKRRLQAGDILFNNTNSVELVGKSALILEDMEAGYSNHLTRLRVDVRRVEPAFVAAVLNKQWADGLFARSCTRWVGQAGVNSTALKEVEVPLPPLAEQRRIVDLLSRAASLKRLADEAQARARELMPALFVDTFGDPKLNPASWPIRPLGDLIDGFEGGHSPRPGDAGASPFSILKLSAVTGGRFDPSECKPAPAGYAPTAVQIVKQGDLLITRANTADLVGACALVDQPVSELLLPDLIWRIRLTDTSVLCSIFLWAFFQLPSTRAEIQKLATGTSDSMRKLSQGRLRTLPVVCPPGVLQAKFKEGVAAAESQVRLAQRAGSAAAALANSLMLRVSSRS